MWPILHGAQRNHIGFVAGQCSDYLRSYSPDTMSQLVRDASNALGTIPESRNSFVPINRIPFDVFYLIAAHLPSREDRRHAAAVCRHWRRTFQTPGTVCPRLLLRNGEAHVKPFLERTNGSLLDIAIDRQVDIDRMITLLSPYSQKIRYLTFTSNHWEDVIKFSAINSGRLPLLHTLEIMELGVQPGGGQNPIPPPSTQILDNAANRVQEFILRSIGFKSLRCFAFPHLTVLNLSARPGPKSNASDLFNFLKASPKLERVKLRLTRVTIQGVTSQRPIVVLPNVKTFLLEVTNGPGVFHIAANISCPSSRNTSIVYNVDDFPKTSDSFELFPLPRLLFLITHRYGGSQVEEVTLDVRPVNGASAGCFLTFRSIDTSTIRFGIAVFRSGRTRFSREVFLHASRVIQAHSQLRYVKRLYISYRHTNHPVLLHSDQIGPMAEEVGKLFRYMGSLDELVIEHFDLGVFFSPPSKQVELPVFPQTKKLGILYPMMGRNQKECMDAIVELAKSQHERGMPFERVTIRTKAIPATIAERLAQYVGVADCSEN